jgi:hypothetical protein
MKKKANIKTVIRQIVREEVAMAISEVVNELKQPTLSSKPVSYSKPKTKIIEKKKFSSNNVLNDILNETANGDMEDWPTMGGETYDSSKTNEVLSSAYSEIQLGAEVNNADKIVGSDAPADIKRLFDKDYSGILKASIEKSKGKLS